MNNQPTDYVINEFLDDEKTLALALAVQYWGMTNQNPATSPAKLQTVLETADKFHRWLLN
jgi:hypothetical protein